MNNHRVVVTGMGALTPLGLDVETTWKNLLSGESGVRRITRFDVSGYPTQFAGEVIGFEPEDYMGFKEAKRMVRYSQLAMAATSQAIESARLDLSSEDTTRVGVEVGTAIGGVTAIEDEMATFIERGPRAVNPAVVPRILASSAACQIAISYGIKGPTNSPVAACATGIVAIGLALRQLKRGEVDVVLAGGSESAVSPLAMVSFSRLGVLSKNNDNPAGACRPFDRDRDGTVMSEGAVVLVLETLEHARRREAPILAEVLGFAMTEDAYHIAAPEPSGDGAASAMALALADGSVAPADVDYVAPHGTGTPLNDVSETRACKKVFGDHAYKVAISSNKSMMGHLLGAAGSVSAMVCILAIRDGIVPPTINLDNPDPECDLDYVPLKARAMAVEVAMLNAFGFGGQNATAVLRQPPAA
jgi:3-oxoacyl-[acyl-carrier-protein] synthase II